MKKLLSIALLFGLVFFVNAQTGKNKNAKYEVNVEGVCGMCKKRIENAAYSVKGVKVATWDQNTKKLSLVMNEKLTDLDKVEHAIAAVGHDTEHVKATEPDYKKLPECCQYHDPEMESH